MHLNTSDCKLLEEGIRTAFKELAIHLRLKHVAQSCVEDLLDDLAGILWLLRARQHLDLIESIFHEEAHLL